MHLIHKIISLKFYLFLCLIFPMSNLYAKKYIDPDNDTILELDSDRRNVLQSVTIKANHIYDDEVQLEKAKNKIQAQILSSNDSEYGVYTVVIGDNLKSISQKLYGIPDRWREIALLNEERIVRNEVKPGTKLRFRKSKVIETLQNKK